MARKKVGGALTPQQALVAILEAVRTEQPLSLNKTLLHEMRRKVIAFASAGLGREHEEVTFREPDPEYMEAIMLVTGYTGRNEFMCSLQNSLSVHGGLTPRQAEAVLSPPWEPDLEQLYQAGVDPTSVQYRFQAIDALAELKKRQRKTADAKAET